jgi:hypothetical protein
MTSSNEILERDLRRIDELLGTNLPLLDRALLLHMRCAFIRRGRTPDRAPAAPATTDNSP